MTNSLFAVSTLALWLTAVAASTGEFNVTRLTNVTGYFFEKVGDMKYRTSTHRLDLTVGLTSYADGVISANDIRRRANAMCLNATGSRTACDDLERSLNASSAYLEDKLEEFDRVRAQLRGRPRARRRRADVASAVLGKLMADGATADDLRWMNDRLETKHRAASELTDRLAGSVESIAVHASADARAVDKNFGKINGTFRRLGDRLRDWAEAERDRQLNLFASRYDELARRLGEMARDLTEAARWPRDALLRWADPAGMAEMLARIGARPTKTLPVNASAVSEVRRLLDVVDVRTRFDEDVHAQQTSALQLRFEVDVPLVFDEPFSLYRLHAVPRTVRLTDGTAAHVRMRGDDYLAVTADFGHYVGLTGHQVAADCRRLGDAFRLCGGRRTVRARTDDAGTWSCEYAQAANVAAAAAATCANNSLEVRDRSEFVRLDAANVWLYWVDRPTTLNVTCGDAPDRPSHGSTHLLRDGVGLLSLADRCGAYAASGHRLITDTVNATSHRPDRMRRRFAAPSVTTYLDVSSAASRLRSIALAVHVTFPVLEPTPSDWTVAVGDAHDVSREVGRHRTELAKSRLSESPRPSGGVSFAESSWQWYAAAAIAAYLLVHFAVKCARKKLLKCALGKSNAKKLKLQRQIIAPNCGE